jgi:type VI secretion system protein ImpI
MDESRMPIPKYAILEVIGAKAAALGAEATHTFDINGGRLGRAADNDWVIEDPYVSRYQAHIEFSNGKFYVAPDPLASAPIFINGPEAKITAPQKYPLNSGDQIIIDEVLIRVELSFDTAPFRPEPSPAHYPGMHDPHDPHDPFGDEDVPAPGPSSFPSPIFARETNPERPNVVPGYSPIEDNFSVPAPAPIVDIPENWPDDSQDPMISVRKSRSQAPDDTAHSMPPVREGTADLLAFLKGAGIDGAALTPEVMSTLGAILRITVGGVVEMLRARNEIRREFRVPMTIAQGREINPLKFSTDATDALNNILVKRNAAFLPGVTAFEEAFDDLRSHQMAMLIGMRAGFTHMLNRFNPEKLEHRFESQAKLVAFKGLAGRSKLWEQYRAWFDEALEDEDDSFRRFFGDEFAKAYEEEMSRLVHSRQQRRKPE